jgi:hypothetical protein
MPWCGDWGTAAGGFWWLMPLFGILFMGAMFFLCFRGLGCMGRHWRSSGEPPDPRRDVESPKDVRKPLREPS